MLTKSIEDPDYIIGILTAYKQEKQEKERLQKENQTLIITNEKMKPNAEYCANVLKSDSLLSVSEIANDYEGMTARKLNNILHEQGIQYKRSGIWILYNKYNDKGYVQSYTYSITDATGHVYSKLTTKWTEKGRKFIYDTLKKIGILPTCEQI